MRPSILSWERVVPITDCSHGGRGPAAPRKRHYALAEAGWRSDAPEPRNLARFLADRGRSLDQAVTIAEQAARDRHDIFTEDALAWAYFRAGRLAEASRASALSLRTGTCDRSLLYHAAAIRHAMGVAEARTLAARSLDGNPRFDLVSAPAARALRQSLAAHAVRNPVSETSPKLAQCGPRTPDERIHPAHNLRIRS